jgi:hypothetical protein
LLDGTLDLAVQGQRDRGRGLDDERMRSYESRWQVLREAVQAGETASEGFASTLLLTREMADRIQRIHFTEAIIP